MLVWIDVADAEQLSQRSGREDPIHSIGEAVEVFAEEIEIEVP